MEDILDLTHIPQLIDKNNALLVQNLTYGSDDLVSWYSSITDQNSNINKSIYQTQAKKAYDRLQLLLTGKYKESAYGLLVDEQNLVNLALNTQLLAQCFKQEMFISTKKCLPPNKAQDAVFLSIYLNTQGLLGHTNVNTILSFYYAWTSRGVPTSQPTQKSGKNAKSYDSFIDELSRDDICALSSANLQLNKQSSSFSTIIERQVCTLREDLRDTLIDPSLNLETLMSEFVVQYLEPNYAQYTFQESVKTFIEVPTALDAHDIMYFDSLLRSKKVNLLGGRRNYLTDSLLNIILPARYRLKAGLTMASVDRLLNILLGANFKQLKKCYSILRFSFIENCYYSDTIIQNITILEQQMAHLNNSSALWDVLERTWNLCATFVIYVELAQLLIEGLSGIQIGCVDSFLNGDCMQADVRQLSYNTIYYHDGFYYFRALPTDNNNQSLITGYKSTHYKPLLIHIWKTANANQTADT